MPPSYASSSEKTTRHIGRSNRCWRRTRLLKEYGLEIGAGLGPLAGKIWRIGLMGYTSRPENIEVCLSALADVLGRERVTVDASSAPSGAREQLGV